MIATAPVSAPPRSALLALLFALTSTGCATRTVYVREEPTPAPAPQVVDDAPPPPRGDDLADAGDFTDPLAPYGAWVSHPRYGAVFVPHGNVVGAGWRPYTRGHWEYTEWGWTWVSDLPFGWATFHYGRWFYDAGLGWAWVPGRQWAPAWVSWRTGGGYIGWAPLPPGASFTSSYHVYDSAWVFVGTRHLGATVIAPVVITGRGHHHCLGATRPYRDTYLTHGHVYYRGPDPQGVRRQGGRVVHRSARDAREDRPTARGHRGNGRDTHGGHDGHVGQRSTEDRGAGGGRGRSNGRGNGDDDRGRGRQDDADRDRGDGRNPDRGNNGRRVGRGEPQGPDGGGRRVGSRDESQGRDGDRDGDRDGNRGRSGDRGGDRPEPPNGRGGDRGRGPQEDDPGTGGRPADAGGPRDSGDGDEGTRRPGRSGDDDADGRGRRAPKDVVRPDTDEVRPPEDNPYAGPRPRGPSEPGRASAAQGTWQKGAMNPAPGNRSNRRTLTDRQTSADAPPSRAPSTPSKGASSASRKKSNGTPVPTSGNDRGGRGASPRGRPQRAR